MKLADDFAEETGIADYWRPNTTIMHTEFARQRAQPGQIVIGAESAHTQPVIALDRQQMQDHRKPLAFPNAFLVSRIIDTAQIHHQVERQTGIITQGQRDRRNTRVKERVNLRHSSCHAEINWNVLAPELQQELQSDLTRVIVQINDREKEVQEAEADLAGLQKAQLMKQRIGQVFHGVITGVQSYGFFVEIEVPTTDFVVEGNPGVPLRVEGLVHVSSLKDDWYEYRARQQALFGRKNRASYRLGDRVGVQVKSVDYYRQQIDLVTVGSDGVAKGLDVNIPNDDLSDIYLPNDLESSDLDPYAEEE
jgi:ribonuclease R